MCSRRRRLGPLVGLSLLVGCAASGLRATPETRYLGALLDARTLGASEVERARKEDPAVRAYVQENGQPDFFVRPTQQDVELIYYLGSVLVQFHRLSPGAPSVMGTLAPLPTALLDILPGDMRAGTPAREADEGAAACWSVTVGDAVCRTCCAGVRACVGGCKRSGPDGVPSSGGDDDAVSNGGVVDDGGAGGRCLARLVTPAAPR